MTWKADRSSYIDLFGGRCELTGVFDRSIRREIEKRYHLAPHRELHHIFGRNKKRPDMYEVRSNWIMLDGCVHAWITAHKHSGTLCCLYAKLKKSRTWFPGGDCERDFLVEDINELIASDTLHDYVEWIMSEVGHNDPHYHYGRLLLEMI